MSLGIRNPICISCQIEDYSKVTLQVHAKLQSLPVEKRLAWLEATAIGKLGLEDLYQAMDDLEELENLK